MTTMDWLFVAFVLAWVGGALGFCWWVARRMSRRAAAVRGLARIIEDWPEDKVPAWMEDAA